MNLTLEEFQSLLRAAVSRLHEQQEEYRQERKYSQALTVNLIATAINEICIDIAEREAWRNRPPTLMQEHKCCIDLPEPEPTNQ